MSAPAATGRPAERTPVTGAARPIWPMAIARYNPISPISPRIPASPPHAASATVRRASLRATAKAARTVIPATWERSATTRTGVRRVARPPLKSPTPQVAAEARPRATGGAPGHTARLQAALAPSETPATALGLEGATRRGAVPVAEEIRRGRRRGASWRREGVGTARGPGVRLVHDELASVELAVVEAANGLRRLRVAREGDEGEAPGTAGLAVRGEVGVHDLPRVGQEADQLVLAGLEAQVPDEHLVGNGTPPCLDRLAPLAPGGRARRSGCRPDPPRPRPGSDGHRGVLLDSTVRAGSWWSSHRAAGGLTTVS